MSAMDANSAILLLTRARPGVWALNHRATEAQRIHREEQGCQKKNQYVDSLFVH
jgi:hypothetical protein